MLTISETIASVKTRSALVPFITAGYPNLETTVNLIYLLDKKGANAIELGIPYSDALADGIVIQESSRIALEQKTYVDQVLKLVQQVSPNVIAPIIIFTYYNPILCRGIDRFVKEIAESGAKGLVVPDLPLEESDYLISLCNEYEIELILFVSPTSSENRIQSIVSKAPGCIYLVSSCGVTGLRGSINYNVQELVKKIKRSTNKCVMLGFGISNEYQVSKLMDLQLDIDAIVMGSAFINKITDGLKDSNYEKVGSFCENIKSAIGNK
uniref:tryptophan synthase alpha subunit n=1 Tax=Lithothamnion corallioides TaxID=1277934 RepID=UPI0023F43864|nr:tryptophan synthase alpha subunit [Lithothamnion corallioides]WEA77106.1 tryptophan synthase alpha subunit [Lithothamnion corallioides]